MKATLQISIGDRSNVLVQDLFQTMGYQDEKR